MKQITAAFKAHLAQQYQTTCSCWLVVRKDGTILGFTDHDQDIQYDLEDYLDSADIHIPARMAGSGLQTYVASNGYTSTDIATGSDLQADDMNVQGPSVPPSITAEVLKQGSWDWAFYIIFWVNWKDLSNTMGALILRCGNIGQVRMGRNDFTAQLHGLIKAYTRNIGELGSEVCRVERLGDERCKVDLTDFTFDGVLTGVSPDGLTLYDTGRTEPGPSGGVVITGITNANPGHVTTATDLGLPDGAAVAISGVVGMTPVNVVTVIKNPSPTGFDLTVDTSDTAAYPAYISAGLATPLGAEAGYFDFGEIAFTGDSPPGPNDGFTMEIKSYVPGQITLMLPLPFMPQAGDPYIIVAGCNRQFFTCKNKFDNVPNMRAEIYLPGVDRMLQVGKQS